jgi:hypothetical protein
MTVINSVTATTTGQSLASLIAALPNPLRNAREVTLQMSPGATGTLYVGGPAGVLATSAVELAAGQSWTIRAQTNVLDLGSIWLLASTGPIRVNCAMEVL